jgi:hypothetical protein
MKRFAPLALIVLAFAATPAAFADDTTPAPAAPATTAAAPAGHPIARMRIEILRLRLQLVHLRYRVVCHQQDSDRCTQFTQKIVDRLTKLDGNVESKLQNCTKGCDVLTKLDTRLKSVIAKLGSPAAPATGDSSLDQAANALGQLAGSTQP